MSPGAIEIPVDAARALAAVEWGRAGLMQRMAERAERRGDVDDAHDLRCLVAVAQAGEGLWRHMVEAAGASCETRRARPLSLVGGNRTAE